MEGTAVTLIRVIIMPAGASACFAISCSTSLGHIRQRVSGTPLTKILFDRSLDTIEESGNA